VKSERSRGRTVGKEKRVDAERSLAQVFDFPAFDRLVLGECLARARLLRFHEHSVCEVGSGNGESTETSQNLSRAKKVSEASLWE
jgi:hypothetical protein